MNPLPIDALAQFDSLEKLILISYNEAVNIYNLTGSKEFIYKMTDHIIRLQSDPTSKGFFNDFFKSHVFKPTLQVIKNIMTEKDFLKSGVFDSEVDAAMYPLPTFIYTIVKSLLKLKPEVIIETRGFLSNSVAVLVGIALANSINAQNLDYSSKLLALASKLLTTVRASLKQNSSNDNPWIPHLADISNNQLLLGIMKAHPDKRISNSKSKESIRVLREVLFEWNEIVQIYKKISNVV